MAGHWTSKDSSRIPELLLQNFGYRHHATEVSQGLRWMCKVMQFAGGCTINLMSRCDP